MEYQCTQCGQEITEQEFKENNGLCSDIIGCWERMNGKSNRF